MASPLKFSHVLGGIVAVTKFNHFDRASPPFKVTGTPAGAAFRVFFRERFLGADRASPLAKAEDTPAARRCASAAGDIVFGTPAASLP